jgi:hypothetical protein
VRGGRDTKKRKQEESWAHDSRGISQS